MGLLLHVGVVARAGEQLTVAHQVQARIAAMHPVHVAALHHRRHQGGARRVEHAFFGGVADDLVVRRHQRARQKLRHLTHRGVGGFLEVGRNGLQGQLRGHGAFGVTTHAVGQHKQARLPRVGVAHPVFVALAAALAADLVDRKFHRNLVPAAVDLRG